MNEKIGKILRIVAIVFLGLTATMNILGGVGTTCAAFGFKAEYRIAFAELSDYLWLYQALVITTILIGFLGIWATVALARGRPNAYRNALVILLIGTVLAAIHYIASQALRGAAAPANVKFYTNAFSLIVFLVIRIPGIWQHIDFSPPGKHFDRATAGGLAAIVAGGVVLSVASWAGPSHTYQGDNWVHVLQRPLDLSGALLMIAGICLLAWVGVRLVRRELSKASRQRSLKIKLPG